MPIQTTAGQDQVANIRLGTASWTDPSLIACRRFYPRSVHTAQTRLQYYASHFPLVEVDSSYYAMPSARNAQLWAERTPAGFVFNVKAFRLFTQHQTPPASLPSEYRPSGTARRNLYYRDLPEAIRDSLWERFRHALQPLVDAGKLGAVHLQFPPWFVARPENIQHLQECRNQLGDLLIAVEFRHHSWFAGAQREATLQIQRDLGCVNVTVDEPQGFDESIPAIWETTHPQLAILRLHGRNRSTWIDKDLAAASDRFNYDYAEAELAELVAPLRSVAARVAQVQVIFNNNFEDQGPRNAATLTRLLGPLAVKPEVVELAAETEPVESGARQLPLL